MDWNFCKTAIMVCVGMAVVDALWAIWTTKANRGHAHLAAFASIGIVAVNALVTVEYVHDRRLIVPAVIGAYIGTVLPLMITHRKS